jgi:hypothetical protein
MEFAITFTPDGTGHALHTECIALCQIGRLSVTRATEIEFDDNAQFWCVRRPGSRFALYRNASRQECLAWERQYLQTEEDRKHELQPRAGAVAACA